jgi:hypothetical protein
MITKLPSLILAMKERQIANAYLSINSAKSPTIM